MKPKTPVLIQRIEKLENDNIKLRDEVDELRLCVKYMQMDLEATKREMKNGR